MGQKLVKDDVRFILFGEVYQRLSEPKNKQKAFVLVENAIQCFDRVGFEAVTLKMIAREASVSPALLKHYFKNLDDIRDVSLRYIRTVAQKIVVDTIGDETDPVKVIRLYFEAHRLWSKNFKTHARVWLNFLSLASKKSDARKLNTAAVSVGRDRLSQILELGWQFGKLSQGKINSTQTAQLIQTIMLGWLTTLITEDLENADAYSRRVLDQCMDLAGLKRMVSNVGREN